MYRGRTARFRLLVPTLLLVTGFFVCSAAGSACMRTKHEASIGSFDGPGSWGPLQDTVTLDCLQYTGSIVRNAVEYVLIRDENGAIYRLKVGDFMGENTGRITKIDEHYIYIEQYSGKDVPPTTVKFKKD
jgi:hypothetical protein